VNTEVAPGKARQMNLSSEGFGLAQGNAILVVWLFRTDGSAIRSFSRMEKPAGRWRI